MQARRRCKKACCVVCICTCLFMRPKMPTILLKLFLLWSASAFGGGEKYWVLNLKLKDRSKRRNHCWCRLCSCFRMVAAGEKWLKMFAMALESARTWAHCLLSLILRNEVILFWPSIKKWALRKFKSSNINHVQTCEHNIITHLLCVQVKIKYMCGYARHVPSLVRIWNSNFVEKLLLDML